MSAISTTVYSVLEAAETYWSKPLHVSAVGALLLASNPNGAVSPHRQISSTSTAEAVAGDVGTSNTFSVTDVTQHVDDLDFFRAVDRVYDHLLSHAMDLDNESLRLLYQDRWDLYV